MRITIDSAAAPMTLAKLKSSVKQSFDKLNHDMKEVHAPLNNYSKQLDMVHPDSVLIVCV